MSVVDNAPVNGNLREATMKRIAPGYYSRPVIVNIDKKNIHGTGFVVKVEGQNQWYWTIEIKGRSSELGGEDWYNSKAIACDALDTAERMGFHTHPTWGICSN